MNGNQVTQGADLVPHRSLVYTAGFTDEEMDKSRTGVAYPIHGE